MERLVIIAGDKESQAGRALQVRASEIAGQVTAQNIASVLGEEALNLGKPRGTTDANSEIILWGRAEGRLTAAWTSLSPQEEVVPHATCDETKGLVAEVLASERAHSLREPYLQANEFTNLGERRGRSVTAMRALPLLLFGRAVGVLSWVAYSEDEDATGERASEVAALALTFSRFGELMILKLCLGLEV